VPRIAANQTMVEETVTCSRAGRRVQEEVILSPNFQLFKLLSRNTTVIRGKNQRKLNLCYKYYASRIKAQKPLLQTCMTEKRRFITIFRSNAITKTCKTTWLSEKAIHFHSLSEYSRQEVCCKSQKPTFKLLSIFTVAGLKYNCITPNVNW
jgi:hypothetical protein